MKSFAKKWKKISLKSKLKQKYAKPLQQELFTTCGRDIFQQETSTIWRIFTQPQRKLMTKGKRKTLKNKEAMRYLRVCFQIMWGVLTPCNEAHFIAIFWLFDSVKIRCKTSEKQWANFVPNKSSIAQSKIKCLYWISVLLLCRDPVEDREFCLGIAQLPPPVKSVCWGRCTNFSCRRIFVLKYASWVSCK